MGAKESGNAFMAGVLAKLPEDKRAAAQALFSDPTAEAALTAIGDGVLARSDYSKQMDDLTKKTRELDDIRERNETWYAENKGAVEEYLTIKPEFERLKAGGTTTTTVATGPTVEQIQTELERRDRSFAGAMALAVNLSSRHIHMFNEPLDTQELLADPKLGTVLDRNTGRVYGLQDAYDAKHGQRVAEKNEAAHKAAIEKEVQERLAEERRKVPQQHPFPLRDSTPSPLDALADTQRKTTDYTVDSAVAKYEELSQLRAGG